jgi:RNA polymerase sigma factor (sigma-70 family)
MEDERLAALAGGGDAAAFEAIYDRHHAALLAFCRHMLGNREDGEDALQQAFVRAHRALTGGLVPDRVRPWLFAIARNRCLTLIAARREAALPAEDLEPSYDGLAADVERRADLRELVADLAQLPDDQREALVLAELGDFSHADIAQVVGCPPEKVKALVFQARTSLIADRDARRTPCEDIRAQLESARGGLLRRGPLRRHLRQCDPCAAYRVAVEHRRAGLAIVLPVLPTAGLKASVLGGAEAAAAAAGSGGLGAGAGIAASAAAPGSMPAPVAGGAAAKALVAKVAVVATLAAGGGVAIEEGLRDEPLPRTAVAEAAGADGVAGSDEVALVAGVDGAGAAGATAAGVGDRAGQAAVAGGDEDGAAAGDVVGADGDGSSGCDDVGGASDSAGAAGSSADGASGCDETGLAGGDGAGADRGDRVNRRRLRRVALRLATGDRRTIRRVRQRLRELDPEDARRIRRRLIRARDRITADPGTAAIIEARIERRRQRRGKAPATTEVAPETIATADPEAATEPAVAEDPSATEQRPRRRRRARPAPTPAPLPAPAPTAEPSEPSEPAEPAEAPSETAIEPAPEPTPDAAP